VSVTKVKPIGNGFLKSVIDHFRIGDACLLKRVYFDGGPIGDACLESTSPLFSHIRNSSTRTPISMCSSSRRHTKSVRPCCCRRLRSTVGKRKKWRERSQLLRLGGGAQRLDGDA
jgi:hypothetical protein